MAFGITRQQLERWKQDIDDGKIAFLTHYWVDERFPQYKTVTKAGCKDIEKLAKWGEQYGLKKEWIHIRQDEYSHFDLLGDKQREILKSEGLFSQLEPFLKN